MLTSDEVHKEQLIYFAQHLIDSELLPSPEEMIVKYIAKGCPEIETPHPLISTIPIATTWREICDITAKTFIYDKEDHKQKTHLIARVIRDIYKITKGRSVAIAPYSRETGFDITLEQLVDRLEVTKATRHMEPGTRARIKISLFYMLVVMCLGGGVDGDSIRNFWRDRGIDGTLRRWHYLVKYHETLAYRGPFATMAEMTVVQSGRNYSRGLYWDALHSIYLTYVDFLFSEDRHFADLRTALGAHPLAGRIIRPSEVQWTTELREITRPETFLKIEEP